MRTIGRIRTELIFSHTLPNRSGAGVVPPETLAVLETEMRALGYVPDWWTAIDPDTGEEREAFTPIEHGRLALIQDRGIRHGERFIAAFEVREVPRNGATRMEMRLVDAEAIGAVAVS